ncbi:MAG TPA: hypothetical protein VMF86_09220 [Stellaceae bacterium]|nr:hypothetical protein [Stellaceae bacterium]
MSGIDLSAFNLAVGLIQRTFQIGKNDWIVYADASAIYSIQTVRAIGSAVKVLLEPSDRRFVAFAPLGFPHGFRPLGLSRILPSAASVDHVHLDKWVAPPGSVQRFLSLRKLGWRQHLREPGYQFIVCHIE